MTQNFNMAGQVFPVPEPNGKFILKSKNSMGIGRHAAKNLEANDFVDLTDEQKCFLCDEVTTTSFYPFARTVTTTTKTSIAQKLGDLMGKKFIVIVSEDDNVCKRCFNLFNQLDSLEAHLANVKDLILKNVESTYFQTKNDNLAKPTLNGVVNVFNNDQKELLHQ